MDYNRGKIGEFDEPVKRKAGRPVSEFTEKIAIYMTKDMLDYINIKGARVNNLKGIDVKIPRDKLTVITGLSGSRKIFSCI